MKKLLVLVAGLLVLSSCSSHHKKHAKHMEMMDSNKDGKISKEEWLKGSEEKFAKFDANSDGEIDETERKTCPHKKK